MRAGPPGPARILFSRAVLAGAALALSPLTAAQPVAAQQQQAGRLASSDQAAIDDFYRERGSRPLWFSGGFGASPAEQLVTLLDRADLDGLDPGDYRSRALARAMRSAWGGSPRAVAQADLLLSQAFVAYVRDLRSGGSTGTIFIDRELKPSVPQAGEILQAAATTPSLDAYISEMGWMHPIYGQIRRAFAGQGGFLDDRAAQLVRINLERARALPVDYGQRYIVVDAAAARLYMYEGGRVHDSMKIVVGKPTSPTPMMAAQMRHAIVNPYWNVPPDLTAERIAPSVLSDGISYFQSKRYQVLSDWGDEPKVVDPTTIDWQAVKDGKMPDIRVRQLPGPDNAMGKVKFEFPNPQGIYLHDTNDPRLFDDAARLFSGGCVRLENAQGLARWLYGKPLTPNSSRPEQRIPLAAPVPVYITYLTVGAEDGRLAYRQDVYNRDSARLAAVR